ncbi:MAG: hypothetical protein ACUVYA_13120 [Planctomycetota bacterium]
MEDARFGSVSHGREEETPEAKARWFQSLPLAERMRVFSESTDLALATPEEILADEITVFRGRVRIDIQTRAAGLPVDRDDARLLELSDERGP